MHFVYIGDSDQDRYFFSNKESKCGNGHQTGRATCSGFWKATGSSKRIICSKRMPIVGIRNSLVFYKSDKHSRAVRTDWIMHEYCIALSGNPACNIQQTKISQVNFHVYFSRNLKIKHCLSCKNSTKSTVSMHLELEEHRTSFQE